MFKIYTKGVLLWMIKTAIKFHMVSIFCRTARNEIDLHLWRWLKLALWPRYCAARIDTAALFLV